jgi:hypothetical protein
MRIATWIGDLAFLIALLLMLAYGFPVAHGADALIPFNPF